MRDENNGSPAVAGMIEEVQGVFPSNAALQDAVGQLRLAGFDHADISLPTTNPLAGEATPNQGAANPLGEDDGRSMRTMGTSMAGTIGAFVAAGATVATGGAAAVVIAAAAAVGAGSALAANAVGTAAIVDQEQQVDAAAELGQLVLAVHVATNEKRTEAQEIMVRSGAVKVGAVRRIDGTVGVDSTSWTG